MSPLEPSSAGHRASSPGLPDGVRQVFISRRLRGDPCARIHDEFADCLVPYWRDEVDRFEAFAARRDNGRVIPRSATSPAQVTERFIKAQCLIPMLGS